MLLGKKVPRKRGRKPRNTTTKDLPKAKEEEGEEEEDNSQEKQQQPRPKKKRLEKAASNSLGSASDKIKKKRNSSRISTIEEKPINTKLMKTMQSFVQDKNCLEYPNTKISKCRECKMTPKQKASIQHSFTSPIFCRFYAFRRLQYNKSGTITSDGFNDPELDADEVNFSFFNKKSIELFFKIFTNKSINSIIKI